MLPKYLSLAAAPVCFEGARRLREHAFTSPGARDLGRTTRWLVVLALSLLGGCGGSLSGNATGAGPDSGSGPSAPSSASPGSSSSTSTSPAQPGTTISADSGSAPVGASSTREGVDASVVLVGSGSFTVMSDDPTGASPMYEQEASFSLGVACPTSTIGFCTVRTCTSAPPQAGLPGVGAVTFTGGQMSSDPLEPMTSGAYASAIVSGEAAWTAGGQAVTVAWAHFPGEPSQPGGSIALASPAYLTLTGQSPLVRSGSLSRSQDLSVTWTSDTMPSSLDQLLVELELGSTKISCAFAATAPDAVVPASLLQYLPAGVGKFDVHSKQYASQVVLATDGTPWQVEFNVDAHVRDGSGLAYGPITFE